MHLSVPTIDELDQFHLTMGNLDSLESSFDSGKAIPSRLQSPLQFLDGFTLPFLLVHYTHFLDVMPTKGEDHNRRSSIQLSKNSSYFPMRRRSIVRIDFVFLKEFFLRCF